MIFPVLRLSVIFPVLRLSVIFPVLRLSVIFPVLRLALPLGTCWIYWAQRYEFGMFVLCAVYFIVYFVRQYIYM